MNIVWQDFHHSELTTAQLYQLLALRNAVFIIEQRCICQDIDGADLIGDNRHLLGWFDDRLLACARILSPEDRRQAVKIGRVLVSGEARGLSPGNRLRDQAVNLCEHHWPQHKIKLSAQAHLQDFYGRFGFKTVSGVYLEDNIPHVDMER